MSGRITVAEARRMRNISQEEAAKCIGVSLGAYRNKETGRSKFYIDEAYALSKLFGLELTDIFFDTAVTKK